MDESALNILRDAVVHSGKTSAMWLQEICVKSGIVPRFFEETLSSVAHDPKFQIRATVDGFNGRTYEALGVAKNKKEGKQIASLNMLYEMGISATDLVNVKAVTAKDKEIDRSSYGDSSSSSTSQNDSSVVVQPAPVVVPASGQSEEISKNVVTDLGELCSKKGLPIPEFNEDFEPRGPPHNRIFTCECTVKMINGEEPLVVQTEAPTKKFAKRKSADLMIKKIRDAGISTTNIYSNFGTGDGEVKGTRTCDNRLKCAELVAHQHHQFLTFQGTVIKSLHEENKLVEFQEDIDYVKILNDAAEQEIFDVVLEVLSIDEKPIKNKEDKFLYRCEMDFGFKIVMNPSTCIASGASIEIAKNRASYEGLLFLKDVTVVV